MRDDLYYILSLYWSEGQHDLCWWRPNRSGYTSDLTAAGLYSGSELAEMHIPTCLDDQGEAHGRDVAVPVYAVDPLARRPALVDSSHVHALLSLGKRKDGE
jgi:hypothetical protein